MARAAYLPTIRPFTYGGAPRLDLEVDPIVVDRLVAGDWSIPCNILELHRAVEQLDQLGLSATRVAVRLGVNRKFVNRHRARLRSAAT